MLDFSRFQVLTFDCYGTLIDWESGLLAALRPVLEAHGRRPSDEEILQAYGELEAAAEAAAYAPYRQVLQEVLCGLGDRFRFTPSTDETDAFPDSIRFWKPFPDTVPALRRLAGRYKLAIISNIDDDLFASSARQMGVRFAAVVTAQQARSYKPSLNNFRVALERLGVEKDKVLHCAESRRHDIAPARELGLASVWVNRHAGRPGPSASGAGEAQADLEVPDLKTLADLAGA